MDSARKLIVATDGSALGNPGAGGWCWWIDPQTWCAGGDPGPVTNNQMEIIALAEALEHLGARDALIEIDSQYVLNAVTKWHHGWRRNGWVSSTGKPVANREMLERVLNLLDTRRLNGTRTEFMWVRGHSGAHRNEAADAGARDAATRSRSENRKLRIRP